MIINDFLSCIILHIAYSYFLTLPFNYHLRILGKKYFYLTNVFRYGFYNKIQWMRIVIGHADACLDSILLQRHEIVLV